jgi:hypothetical protein
MPKDVDERGDCGSPGSTLALKSADRVPPAKEVIGAKVRD